MLSAVQIKPDVYWVGALNRDARVSHGMTIADGTSYNAYLIIDEKVTLIDGVRLSCANEMIQRISSVVDPSSIDVIISNHGEPDQCGSLPAIKRRAPHAEVYASAPRGVQGLTELFGDLGYHPVKLGDTLSIGTRELTFITTPMVPWPDCMMTYSAYDKTLFSSILFSQNLCCEERFDDQVDGNSVMRRTRMLYANVLQPYRAQVARALKNLQELGQDAIDMIAPASGVVWRGQVAMVRSVYEHVFASTTLQRKALVVYDSTTGSTTMMAVAIAEALEAKDVHCVVMNLATSDVNEAMSALLDCTYVAVGSPTLHGNMLPSVAAFLMRLRSLSPENPGQTGIAFGSYGWMPHGAQQIDERLKELGFEMPLDAIVSCGTPSDAFLDELGKKITDIVA